MIYLFVFYLFNHNLTFVEWRGTRTAQCVLFNALSSRTLHRSYSTDLTVGHVFFQFTVINALNSHFIPISVGRYRSQVPGYTRQGKFVVYTDRTDLWINYVFSILM